MAYFARLKNYYVEDVEELLERAGHLKPYLRVYEERDVLLFNSRSRGEAKLLSNFHASSVLLPWRGLHFSSVEAMIFYTYIADNCNNPKWEEEKQTVLNLILASKDGREVKNCEAKNKLYRKVRKAFVKAYGEENWDLYAWRIACEAVKVKYEYCPEFRKFIDDNSDKIFAENSFWKKMPKAGALKVTDENSPYFGKYIGCHFTGVAIQRCIQEKEK